MISNSGFQVGRDAPQYYEKVVGRIMAPFVDALVAATVKAGDSVLDVACGTGFATRAAAAMAGRGARVEGSDINPAMVAQAQTVRDDSGADLRWRRASALELPYEDGAFDAVICQQGLQFFLDKHAGIQEMARISRPGGRMGVTVWAPSEQSPFLHYEAVMLSRWGGPDPSEWSATEEELRAWFAGGGLNEVDVELLSISIDLPPVLSYVPAHLKAMPWSAGFLDLSGQEQATALADLEAELADYRTDDGIRVPFSSYLVTATI